MHRPFLRLKRSYLKNGPSAYDEDVGAHNGREQRASARAGENERFNASAPVRRTRAKYQGTLSIPTAVPQLLDNSTHMHNSPRSTVVRCLHPYRGGDQDS